MLTACHKERYNFAMTISWLDKLLVALHRMLPARLLGSFVYLLSRSRRRWLKNTLIRGFTWLYDVDTGEAARSAPDGFASFNDFFTRELKEGARIVNADPTHLTSPADGTIAQTGHAANGQLLQAKGMYFSAAGLLADDDAAEALRAAPFATVYLAPYNYHRVHMPVAGRLIRTRFVPGKLYSVNARTTAVIPDLYAVNERLVCEFETAAGPFALVLVGAMNVASITTAWGGEIFPKDDGQVVHRDWQDERIELAQGEYLGHFNLGSTVVMLGPNADCAWNSELGAGQTVRMGELLGRLTTRPQS